MKNNLLKFFSTIFIFAVFFAFSVGPASAAGKLSLDPANISLTQGAETEIKLQIDPGGEPIFGSDAILNFNPSDLDIISVSSGGFFPDFSFAQSTGKLEIHGYFSSSFDSKSQAGTFAHLKFKALKNSGSESITFTCTQSGNDTQILNTNGQNILSCGSLNQSTVTFSQNTNNNQNPTNTATPTPKTTPTAKPKETPTQKPSPTPQGVTLTPIGERPEDQEQNLPRDEYATSSDQNSTTIVIIGLIFIALVGVSAIWFILRKRKSSTPSTFTDQDSTPPTKTS